MPVAQKDMRSKWFTPGREGRTMQGQVRDPRHVLLQALRTRNAFEIGMQALAQASSMLRKHSPESARSS